MASAIPSGVGRGPEVEKKSAKAAGLVRNKLGVLVLPVKSGPKKYPVIIETIVFEGDYIDDLEKK